jgi:hypothetical protein
MREHEMSEPDPVLRALMRLERRIEKITSLIITIAGVGMAIYAANELPKLWGISTELAGWLAIPFATAFGFFLHRGFVKD